MRSELIDLNLAKLADVADTLALEGPKVGGDSGILEVDDAGEGFVQKAANREDREVTGFGLFEVLALDHLVSNPRLRVANLTARV